MTPPRPPLPPTRLSPTRASSAASDAGRVVLLAVFSSIFASAATCFVIIRFSLVSPSEKPAPRPATVQLSPGIEKVRTVPSPNTNRVAPRVQTSVTKDEPQPNAPADELNPPSPAPALRQIAADAPAVLELISVVRNPDAGYIVGSKHSQLGRELQAIEAIVNRLTQYPDLTPDETAKLVAQYANALTAAINRADNIASRETEDPASVEVSRTLKTRLQQTRDALPQP